MPHAMPLVSSVLVLLAGVALGGADVRLKGYYGDRLDRLIANQVAATDVDYLTAPFHAKGERTRLWHTEFWGKYMHTAPYFQRYSGNAELRARIERGVERILDAQEESGYIGNYPDELRFDQGWDVWGMKYTMLGLLHHYDDTGDERALSAAKRLCDHVIAEVGPDGRRGRPLYKTGAWAGYASSSILEPVVWLYRRTREKRYLDFAAYVVRGMDEAEDGPRLVDLALKGVPVAQRNGYGLDPDEKGGYVMVKNRLKAYEMMSCYQGLLDYWQETGEERLYRAAVMTGEQILRDEINLAGSAASSEIWYGGAKKQHLPYLHQMETCVTTTWMRFAAKLLEVTGDPKWADAIERTFYNAYLAAISPEHDRFCSYTPMNGSRGKGGDSCRMYTNCCSMNGPRGFLTVLGTLLQAKADKAILNYYVSGSAQVKLADGGRTVRFDTFTAYPTEDEVQIVNATPEPGTFTLTLRIPAWSGKTTVTVNGRSAGTPKAGTYFDITREWKVGDLVRLKLDLTPRHHFLDHHVAFTSGPLLLARDARFHDGPLDEPIPLAPWGLADPDPEKAVETVFTHVRPPVRAMATAFAAPFRMGAHRYGSQRVDVHFCDFASAGNTWEHDDAYRVWLPFEYSPKCD